jgi:hypothetical protein
VISTVTLSGSKELQKLLKKASKDAVVKANKETYASGLDVQRVAREKLKEGKTWDTGHLATTIIVEASADKSMVEVGPTAPYGVYVAVGTKPHFPPLDALEDWARRHGFDSAWPICKAISERGLQPRPYLLPAFLEVEPKFMKRLKGILG